MYVSFETTQWLYLVILLLNLISVSWYRFSNNFDIIKIFLTFIKTLYFMNKILMVAKIICMPLILHSQMLTSYINMI